MKKTVRKVFFRLLTFLLLMAVMSSCHLFENNSDHSNDQLTQGTDREMTDPVTTDTKKPTDTATSEEPPKPDDTTKPDEPVTPDIPDGVTKIACVGDSLTYGGGYRSAYPNVLQGLLGTESYYVGNFGANGRTMTMGLSDPPNMPDRSYYDSQEYRDSIAFAADIVILCLGTNDTWRVDMTSDAGKAAYLEALEQFVRSYYEAGAEQVYVCLPPDCIQTGNYGDMGDIIEMHIIPMLRRQATALNYQLIDFFSATRGHTDWFTDKVHFTADGYAAMANVAYSVLTNAGSSDLQLTIEPYGSMVKDAYKFDLFEEMSREN